MKEGKNDPSASQSQGNPKFLNQLANPVTLSGGWHMTKAFVRETEQAYKASLPP